MVNQHTVRPQETLSGIALARLGSASRWPEIYAANRTDMDAAFARSGLGHLTGHSMKHPSDYLRVGQILTLPQ